jgi:hypothetical protein
MMVQMFPNGSRPGEVAYGSFCRGDSTIMAAQLKLIGCTYEIDPG